MKNLVTTTFTRDNADGTSLYSCELKRDNITVKDFVDAIRRSINCDKDRAFNEWWAVCYIYFIGGSWIDSVASFVLYPEYEYKVELDGSPSTIDNIISKYGGCAVRKCSWEGGWGRGDYYLEINKPKEAIEILRESHNIDWANYKPPSESAKELFAFPRALPTELKGIAV